MRNTEAEEEEEEKIIVNWKLVETDEKIEKFQQMWQSDFFALLLSLSLSISFSPDFHCFRVIWLNKRQARTKYIFNWTWKYHLS